MPDPDLNAIAEAAAAQPQTTIVDGTTVSQHSLTELANLADRQAAKSSANKNHRGLRFNKLIPPGATR